jgi:protein-tyrosine phosphatase
VSDAGPSIIDLHSHLVPGVDDGARSIADAMEGLGRMVARGVDTIITTPHLDGSLTRDPGALRERLATVDAAFGELQAAASRAHPTLTLMRGHEVKLDIPDPDLSDPRIRLGNSNFILVEWPRLLIPPETPPVLARLGSAGVRLLIAHPERYGGYDPELHLVEKWRKEGAFLQANFGSLIGRYGPAPRAVAFRLLERGWVDCLATDFHGRPHLRLFLDAARETFERLGAERAWDMLTQVNPERISRGDEPLPVPPVEGGRGLVDRIRSLFRAG